jgi:ParB/RepB/Spo0J family partition protein
MQFRDHPGVQGKRDAYPFDPRLLKIDASYNVRDLDAADERADLDELKESIRANGVRVPLEVRLVDEDVFVVAGHRRHKAVMELIAEGEEIKAVPVMPEPKHTSDVDRIINLVVSNSGKPLKPLEVAEVVRRLVAFGWDHGQIAKRLGWKSTSSVTKHLDLIKLPEGVKEQVRENVISATEAARVVRNLPKGVSPERAEELIKANQEENRKLGVGLRRQNKVTARTLARDRPKADKAGQERPEPQPPAPIMAPNAEVEVHPQLQTAVARENGQAAPVVTLPEPAPPPVVHHPSLKHLIDAKVQAFLGRIALLAEDHNIGEREPGETIPAPIDLIAEGDRLYRQIIGDTTADEAA